MKMLSKALLFSLLIIGFGTTTQAAINRISINPPVVGCADTFTTTTLIGSLYAWDFGPNSYPSTMSSALPAGGTVFLTPGSRTVKVTITTGGGPVVETLIVNVLAGTGSVTLTAFPSPVCQGVTTTFSAGGTQYAGYAFFINDTLKQLSASDAFQAVLGSNDSVRVFGSNGGCFSNGSAAIRANPLPGAATLTSSIANDTICSGELVVFTANPAGGNKYLFYNGGAQQQANATNTWSTTQLGQGNQVIVIVQDANGCQSAWSNIVRTFVKPTPIMGLSYRAGICYGEINGQASVNPTQGIPPYTYQWSNGSSNDTVYNFSAGAFSVTVSGANSCSVTASGAFIPSTQIWYTSILDLHLCAEPAYGNLSIVDTGGTGGAGSRTYSLEGFATNMTGQFSNIPPGNYNFTITDSVGCMGNGIISIPQGVSNAEFNVRVEPASCNGNDGGIIITPADPQSGVFQFALNGGGFQFDTAFRNLSGGDYTINIKNLVFGCTYTESATVPQPDQISVNASPDSIIGGPGETHQVTLTVSGTEAPSYNWSPVEGLSCTDCANPIITTSVNTVYYVTVSEGESGNCDGYDSIVVIIAGEFDMPNAFAPGGNMAQNKTFGPVSNGTVNINTFRIYNRWGQLVHNANTFWDGKFGSKDQPVGTYVYYIELEVPDANSPGGSKIEKRNGNVTLVR
ncbi:MAG: gliding motility-associated C-terminal domain-containing protein [Bacteroidetes bacterium]|nr:gliding motility-associated C-terminal domain-containing protein [Bacteroidota bacterium]